MAFLGRFPFKASPKPRRATGIAALILALAMTWGGAALAGAPLDVNVGGTRIIRLSRPAEHVIVGNPAVADVTVETPKVVVIFGKQMGGTSLSILDGDGNVMLDSPVVVGAAGSRAVSVTFAGGKDKAGNVTQSYLCGAVTCVRAPDVTGGGAPAN